MIERSTRSTREPSTQVISEEAVVSPGNKGKLLIFIVAYNAERTIEGVLRRIPASLADRFDVEVLIIDDSSLDDTFLRSETASRKGIVPFKLTVLYNPVNQGYGGNQKIGFHYAIANDFDWVALVHGDGQYAPECLPELIVPLVTREAEAVFGSRMLEKGGALKGGMPLYKFVGNKILTWFQNRFLRTALSEFHSGYRLYSTQALAKIPFELNSNDFHFDTEIIIQFVIAGLPIRELPIPTYYGDEVCHVSGLHYAWNVFLATLQARVQRYHIFYDRKYDCRAEEIENESGRLSFLDRKVLARIRNDVRILVAGGVSTPLRNELERKRCQLTTHHGERLVLEEGQLKDFDYLLLADGGIPGENPESMIRHLRVLCAESPDIVILLHVGNVAFLVTRLLLLFGRFAYSQRGIINLQQRRLFTLRSLRKLFAQNGFDVISLTGIPVPYDRFIRNEAVSKLISACHYGLIRMHRGLFSYEFLLVAKPRPSLEYLLQRAEQLSERRRGDISIN
jgi:glycosyltransferase involved in cell wall biosynthesis